MAFLGRGKDTLYKHNILYISVLKPDGHIVWAESKLFVEQVRSQIKRKHAIRLCLKLCEARNGNSFIALKVHNESNRTFDEKWILFWLISILAIAVFQCLIMSLKHSFAETFVKTNENNFQKTMHIGFPKSRQFYECKHLKKNTARQGRSR